MTALVLVSRLHIGNSNYKAKGCIWLRFRLMLYYRNSHTRSVSNGSRQPASSPGWGRKNCSDQFQTHPETWPATSWWAKPVPIPINPQVLQNLARPDGSNLRFSWWGCLFMFTFRYPTIKSKILPLVLHCLCVLYLLPLYSKRWETCSLLHLRVECQQSANNVSTCIMGKISGSGQQHRKLWQLLTCKWISLHLPLHLQHLASSWRHLILSAKIANATRNILSGMQSYEVRFQETKVGYMHIISSTGCGAHMFTDHKFESCKTRMLLPLHSACIANYHIEIGFRKWNYTGSFVVTIFDKEIVICDDISPWKAMGASILLCASICLISVTKLWDSIIHLCVCRGDMGNTEVQ